MQCRINDGFSILLPAADAIRLFGEKLNLYCIAAVHQVHFRLRLIVNLSAQPELDTPRANDTTDR